MIVMRGTVGLGLGVGLVFDGVVGFGFGVGADVVGFGGVAGFPLFMELTSPGMGVPTPTIPPPEGVGGVA